MTGSSAPHRWGIAATGGIARDFVSDLARLDDARVVAVGSRTVARADEFADEHDIERRHGSYEDLAADPEVDIVYVASPHSRHAQDTLLFLEAGKHVLCEKPFALNAQQARAMVNTARARGLFLMEAVWSRFLPAYVRLRDLVEAGTLGDLQFIDAGFGFAMPVDPDHRLFNRELGGGALLDLGIYPLQLCEMLLGPPDRIAATGHLGETHVDGHVAAALHHAGGGLATVRASLRAQLTCEASIGGTDALVGIPAFMHCPDYLTVVRRGVDERIDCSFEGNGLRFQAAEVHGCLHEGRTESAVMPLGATCSLAETMDTIRGQIGMRYAPDEASAEQIGEHRVDPFDRAS